MYTPRSLSRWEAPSHGPVEVPSSALADPTEEGYAHELVEAPSSTLAAMTEVRLCPHSAQVW